MLWVASQNIASPYKQARDGCESLGVTQHGNTTKKPLKVTQAQAYALQYLKQQIKYASPIQIDISLGCLAPGQSLTMEQAFAESADERYY